MAASSVSTAASASSSNDYDVVINSRGPDVRTTFASHLYDRLFSAHGLRVFFDAQQMRAGDDLLSQIKQVIGTASVHVAIFARGYAESRWCLDELSLMLESRAPIIPVFYDVKPDELRWRQGKGVYAESLHKMMENTTYDPQTGQEKPRYDPNTIQKWLETLSRVADISGFELEAFDGDEAKLLENVVQRVLKEMVKKPLDAAKYPVGLDEKVKDFETAVLLQQRSARVPISLDQNVKDFDPTVLLQQQSGRVQVVGITGMAGVGKTTLAKEFFNRKSSHYSKSFFLSLSDERENAERSLRSLQSELFRGLTQSDLHVDTIDQDTEMLRRNLSSSLVLLVLDDLHHVDQLAALLFPFIDVLHPDSLILITSRDRDILTMSGAQESSIYKLIGLNAKHSRELFCLHAFHQPHPLLGFEYWVDEFLRACDGLPLSLKVVGSLLCGINKKSYWEYQLGRIERILPNEIQQRLKISYDALCREEQQIFLDIACFFIGEAPDTAIRTWEALGWKGFLGFQNLHNKCIVEVDRENRIHMHNHFRALEEMVRRDVAETSELPQVGHRT